MYKSSLGLRARSKLNGCWASLMVGLKSGRKLEVNGVRLLNSTRLAPVARDLSVGGGDSLRAGGGRCLRERGKGATMAGGGCKSGVRAALAVLVQQRWQMHRLWWLLP